MEDPPPQEEDFTSLPISERLAHKNWKARVSAYNALIKTFGNTASDTDPAFKPYVSNADLLKKFATDANAVAQEKGVECLVALVKFAGETAAKTRETVMPALVDKCLGSTRAGTKTQAIELSMQYVEVENGGAGITVCGYILTGGIHVYTTSSLGRSFGRSWRKATEDCRRLRSSVEGISSVSL